MGLWDDEERERLPSDDSTSVFVSPRCRHKECTQFVHTLPPAFGDSHLGLMEADANYDNICN